MSDGLPVLEGGRVLDVANVVWCTGFQQDFSWIDIPVTGDDGWPVETRGVVPSSPGLYFVGLAFQYAFASMLVAGVGRAPTPLSWPRWPRRSVSCWRRWEGQPTLRPPYVSA